MLLQDRFWVNMARKDNNHDLGHSAAIVCGMICGVALKVVVLTEERGLRISRAKEIMCYLVVLLNILVLCTIVPGGQSFVAYFIVYHGLIKARADNRNYLILTVGVYSLWVYLTLKGFLSVDWLFVVVTVVITTLWSILCWLLHMGNTFVNRFRIHIIFLMASFVAFNYDRFVAPALIMVVQIFAYTTTKIIAKTQTWYITSK